GRRRGSASGNWAGSDSAGCRRGCSAGYRLRDRRAACPDTPIQRPSRRASPSSLPHLLQTIRSNRGHNLPCEDTLEITRGQAMKREYHKWYSERLGREMELLVFGHDGLPAVVFPTSQGRFFEFEDQGMVGALRDKLEGGQM